MSDRRRQLAAEELGAPLADPHKELPSGWTWTTVKTVGDVTLGRQRSPKDHNGPDMRPYLRVANVYEDRIDTSDVKLMNFSPDEFIRFQLKYGDLLLNEGQSKELVGRPAIFRGEVPNACFQNTLVRFRCLAMVRPAYVLAIFRCYLHTGEFRRIARWTTNIAHLGAQRFAEMDFPLAPLAEQQRIVEALESYSTRLDDTVTTLQRVERNLERYRASVLKAAVEGRLVPTEAALAKQEGREYEPASVLLERILIERRRRWSESGKQGKYQEVAPPETSRLPELPEGWCWATMPQLGELNRGKSKHRPRNDPRLLGGSYPFVQTGDVRHSECFIETYNNTYSEFGLAQSRLWPAGTLCITIAANIAETGILSFSACFPDSVVGFLQEDPMLTRYVELFLRTARERLNQYAPATAQKNINLQILSEVAVPLPPAAEQMRIVSEIDQHMSVARHAEGLVSIGTLRSARLRQSILKWAFEGKLADQDPNDEPASVLLERIKAKREADKPAKAARAQRDNGKKKKLRA